MQSRKHTKRHEFWSVFTYTLSRSENVLVSRQSIITISDGGGVISNLQRATNAKESILRLFILCVSPKPTGLAKGNKMCCKTHQSAGQPRSLKSFKTPKCPKTSVSDTSIAFVPTDSSKEILPHQGPPISWVPISHRCLWREEEWAAQGGETMTG